VQGPNGAIKGVDYAVKVMTSKDLAMVDASASEIAKNSNGIAENVGELKQMAVELNEIVGRFKY